MIGSTRWPNSLLSSPDFLALTTTALRCSPALPAFLSDRRLTTAEIEVRGLSQASAATARHPQGVSRSESIATMNPPYGALCERLHNFMVGLFCHGMIENGHAGPTNRRLISPGFGVQITVTPGGSTPPPTYSSRGGVEK